MNTFKAIALSALMVMPVVSMAVVDTSTLIDQTVYVHLPQLMGNSKEGMEANKKLEKMRAEEAEALNKHVKDFETAKVTFEKANKEFESKKSFLKDIRPEEERIIKLGRDVAKREADLKEAAEDAQKRFQAAYVKFSEDLFKDQVESITQWAVEQKVAAVVDADSGRVLYRRENVDVTKEILKVVDIKHEQKLAKAKTPAPAAPTKVASTPLAPAASKKTT